MNISFERIAAALAILGGVQGENLREIVIEQTQDEPLASRILAEYKEINTLHNHASNVSALPVYTGQCKNCTHQIKRWNKDKRFKNGGYWFYSCEINESLGGDDEFCSQYESKVNL